MNKAIILVVFILLSSFLIANEKTKDIEYSDFEVGLKKTIDSLCFIGNTYRDNGDYYKADLYYNNALYILKNNKLNWPSNEAYIYHLIGNNYTGQKKYTNAIQYFERAETLYIIKKDVKLVSLYATIAYIYSRLKQNHKAKEYSEKAISFLEKFNDEFDYDLSIAYKSYGLICKENGEFDKAEELFLKSHNIVLKYSETNPDLIANSLNYIAFFYYDIKQYKKALKYFQKSINTIIPQFNDSNYYINPTTEQIIANDALLYSLRRKARTFYLLYNQTSDIKDLEASVSTFELTMALIDRSRNENFGEESNLTFSKDYKETVNYAIETIIEIYKLKNDTIYLNKLFQYSEMGKASLLFRSIKEAETLQTDTNYIKLKEYDKKYHSAISILRTQMQVNYDNKKSKQLNKLILLHDKLENFIEKNYHTFNTSKLDTKPILLHDMQKKLMPQELLLEYCLLDSILICFAIEQNNIEIIETKIDSTLDNIIFNYRNAIANPETKDWANDFNKFVSLSKSLYNILIYPVKDKIAGKKLIIVPDDKLLYIPFETLVNNEKYLANDYKNLNYLIRNNAISYTYSASLKYENKTPTKIAHKNFIAFAPDYSRLLDISDTSGEYLKNKNQLTEIEYAKDECLQSAKLFNGKSIIDELANEKNFKQIAGYYSIIHMAMHTSINDINPLLSRFYFTYTADTTQDNCLNTYELYNMHLNADMVVLSGCNTGLGKMYEGEGLYNLARGFINAGCSAILITLWNTDDKSGSKIIIEFYKNIKQEIPKDIALQNAKTQYLDNAMFMNQAHPYYWSGFILIGDTNYIKNDKTLNEKLKIYFFLSLIFVAFIYFLASLRKKHH